MLAGNDPQRLLDTALNAIATGPQCCSVLDDMPVAIYITDAAGAVTYWNRACVEFAGREPELGRDRWCVTWQLFTTTGEPMQREDCPMAQAIRQQRPVRDVIAIAERPDGSRVAFKPYPTPLFGQSGEFEGALNLMIDVTDEQSEALQEQANRCRRLAEATYDRATSKVLGEMASGFEKTACKLTATRG
ncbi:MAG: PAS domain-containing protein [Sphingomicrobium sp.]